MPSNTCCHKILPELNSITKTGQHLTYPYSTL
uniref:Uncharacterized protein n=1 Tax=Rhizophora mucronata TaxID=61149 RepID=A0A2P2P9V7_RHIMU